MKTKEVIDKFGGEGPGAMSRTAKAFGRSKSAASKWLLKEHVPVDVALMADILSDGELPFDKEHYQAELIAELRKKI